MCNVSSPLIEAAQEEQHNEQFEAALGALRCGSEPDAFPSQQILHRI